MGIILTFIIAMIAVVAGMILLPFISGFINLFCDEDKDEKEDEE